MLLFQYDRRVVTYQLGFPLQAVSEWEPDTLSSAFLAMQTDGKLSIFLFTLYSFANPF
jgi:hypothetical protein